MREEGYYDYLQNAIPVRGFVILISVISIPFWGLLLWILTNPAFYSGGYRDLWPLTCLWQTAGEGVVEESVQAPIPMGRTSVRYFRVQFRYRITKGPFSGYQGQGFCYCRDLVAPERRSIAKGDVYDVLIFNGNKDVVKLDMPLAISTDVRPNRLYQVGAFVFILIPTWLFGVIWLEYYNGKRSVKKGGPKRIRYQKPSRIKHKAKRKRFRKK